jgi:transaldolase
MRFGITESCAQKVMDDLAKSGISMKAVTTKLTTDGVKLFADAFHKLLAVVEKSVEQKGREA